MSHPSAELDARLEQLRSELGLSGMEIHITRVLAEAYRDGLIATVSEVPPSRRRWAEFWEDNRQRFVDRVARTGLDLLGPDAGAGNENCLRGDGRLLTGGVVRLVRRGIRGIEALASRYTLTAKAARRLFEGCDSLDAEALEIGLHLIEPAGAPAPSGGSAPPEGDPITGARRFSRDWPPPQTVVNPGGEPAKRGPRSWRSASPAEDPEATPEEALFDLRIPEIGFDQVFLPAETLQEIRTALVQIRKHPLLVERWGLGERYRMGRGLAFNFAGPAGTGKTLTAEAVAKDLGRLLLTVKYSGLESKWIGETGKHIAAVFAAARRHEAVLFFDEADAIASRRTANLEGSGRHYNLSVNILLRELEEHDGVVIFATNLAANFDPAFERRIQSHVLFRIPEAEEREQIWRAHLPPRAPLAPDVDLRRLAEDFEMAGGDIRNAVLKAVRLAALAEAPDEALIITQQHLLAGAQAISHARTVMTQSILAGLTDGGA